MYLCPIKLVNNIKEIKINFFRYLFLFQFGTRSVKISEDKTRTYPLWKNDGFTKKNKKNQDSKTLIWLFDEFKYLTVFIGVDEEKQIMM